jgi:hypothetical protein
VVYSPTVLDFMEVTTISRRTSLLREIVTEKIEP